MPIDFFCFLFKLYLVRILQLLPSPALNHMTASGVPGMIARLLGARVVLTEQDELLSLLKGNLAANFAGDDGIRYAALDWERAEDTDAILSSLRQQPIKQQQATAEPSLLGAAAAATGADLDAHNNAASSTCQRAVTPQLEGQQKRIVQGPAENRVGCDECSGHRQCSGENSRENSNVSYSKAAAPTTDPVKCGGLLSVAAAGENPGGNRRFDAGEFLAAGGLATDLVIDQVSRAVGEPDYGTGEDEATDSATRDRSPQGLEFILCAE